MGCHSLLEGVLFNPFYIIVVWICSPQTYPSPAFFSGNHVETRVLEKEKQAVLKRAGAAVLDQCAAFLGDHFLSGRSGRQEERQQPQRAVLSRSKVAWLTTGLPSFPCSCSGPGAQQFLSCAFSASLDQPCPGQLCAANATPQHTHMRACARCTAPRWAECAMRDPVVLAWAVPSSTVGGPSPWPPQNKKAFSANRRT